MPHTSVFTGADREAGLAESTGRTVLRRIGLESLIDFLETTSYGVCITGDDHTWVYLNPAGERIIGHRLPDVIGKDYLLHFREHEREALLRLEGIQRQGDTDFYINTVVQPDGTEVEMTWSGTVMQVDGVELAPAIFHETTDVRRAQRNAVQVAAAVHAAGHTDRTQVLDTLVADAVTESRAAAACLLLDDAGTLTCFAAYGLPDATPAAIAESGAGLEDLPGIEDLRRGRSLFLSDAPGRYAQRPATAGWAAEAFRDSLTGAAQFPVWMDGQVAGCLVVLLPAAVTSPSEAELAAWSSLADQASIVLGADGVRRSASDFSAMSERNRIARDLHDSVSQGLFSLLTRAQVVRRGLASGNTELALEAAKDLEELARGATTEMRALLSGLRLGASDDLASSLRELAAEATRRHAVAVDVSVSPASLPPLAADLCEHVRRIAGEALHNVVKHAGASTARVALTTDGDGLALVVEDDGRGFDTGLGGVGPGLGQQTMRERARLAGGELCVTSGPGRGTLVELRVPLTS